MKPLRKNIARLGSAIRTAFRSGIRTTIEAVYRSLCEKRNYSRWLEKFGSLDEGGRQQIRAQIEAFQDKPLISVLLPVFNVDEKWLRLCIDSVLKQVYTNWELCIADDCSPGPHVRRVLKEYEATDKRIKLVYRETNGHISAASNSALELAAGEFAVLLDHDDELSEDALFWVANELNEFPGTMMLYSDEDLIDEKGRRFAPKFKPDWSRDLFYSINIITHLSAYRTSLLRDMGGFRMGFEGSQDYDLALRVIEKIDDQTDIRHIPRILYHWRAIRGSVAHSGGEKPYAHERAREALREHFKRIGKNVTVTETTDDLHRVQYKLPDRPPKVSLILMAYDAETGLKRAAEYSRLTRYPDLEIVLITQNSSTSDHANELTFVQDPGTGEASALNLAADKSRGEVLCFADIKLLPRSDDWLRELAGFAIQNEIGAVGGKVLSQNETVLGSGLVLGAGGTAGTAHKDFPGTAPGNMARNRLSGNYSAVSVSCMAVRRGVFDDIGGFDDENLPNNLFDADFCLRLGGKDRRIVFTPYAELIQRGSETVTDHENRVTAAELSYFGDRWSDIIRNDPFYNPNLSKKDAGFSIDV